jgi:hypothetical protein
MAEEATIDEVETDAPADPLAEFEALRAAAPESEGDEEDTAVEGDEPEQESGDEDSAETEAGDAEAEVEETPAEEIAEGPSFLMKQEAARAGLDPKFIALAKDDAQLEQMIEASIESREVADKTEPVVADEPITLDLPEDEFAADDPIRKALSGIVEKFNAKLEKANKTIGLLAGFANERLEKEEQDQQRVYQDNYTKLFSPFDEVLDSFDSPVLGKTGKLTKTQQAERAEVAKRYQGLGATVDLSAEEKKRFAELAVAAHRSDLVEQRNKKQQADKRQSRQVLGGGGGKLPVGTKTREDILREWDKGLRAGALPLEK